LTRSRHRARVSATRESPQARAKRKLRRKNYETNCNSVVLLASVVSPIARRARLPCPSPPRTQSTCPRRVLSCDLEWHFRVLSDRDDLGWASASVGLATYDGNGTTTVRQTIRRNGVTTQDLFAGPTVVASYEVDPDCAGRLVNPDGTVFGHFVSLMEAKNSSA